MNFLKNLTQHPVLVYTSVVSSARNQNLKKNVVFLVLAPWFLIPGHTPANFSSLQPRKCEDIQGLQGSGFGNLTEISSLDFPLDLKSGGVKLSLRKAFKMNQNNSAGREKHAPYLF